MKKILGAVLALCLLSALPAAAVDTISSVASCGAAGSVVIPLNGPGYTAMTVDLSSANQNGTIGFFATGPRQLAWVALPVSPLPNTTPVTTVTSAGSALTFQGTVQIVGYTSICITGTSWTSGSTTVVAVPLVGQWEPLFLDVPIGNMTGTAGTVVAPGAGAAIASITPGAGTYDITITLYVGTGAVAAEANNFALKIGGTTVTAGLPVPPSANAFPVTYTFRRMVVSAATAVTVNAVGAATASVPYSASIQLLPVN